MPHIQMSTTNSIATITIDAPPVNALGPDGWVALRDSVRALSDDPEVRAVVLRGTAGRFCAGADIAMLAEPREESAFMLRLVGDAADAIRACRVPVLAAIDGPAHGGGLELALACDIRIASPTATFAASGVNMGLIASVPALAATIGVTRSSVMLLTGQPITAEQAVAWALVSSIDDDALGSAQDTAEGIAQKAPLAVEANKVALRRHGSVSRAEHEALVVELFTELEGSADHHEAVDAFLNKRRPLFTRS